MAALMRRFARGGMTVTEFEDVAEKLSESDIAVGEAQMFAWYYYDDFRTETMSGKWRLSRESRRFWEKWVLFLLTSDEEYAGPSLAPDLTGCFGRLAILIAFGATWLWLSGQFIVWMSGFSLIYVWFAERWILGLIERLRSRVGNGREAPDYWPFASAESYRRAIAISNPFAVQDPLRA